jgi:hypothetical protein
MLRSLHSCISAAPNLLLDVTQLGEDLLFELEDTILGLYGQLLAVVSYFNLR